MEIEEHEEQKTRDVVLIDSHVIFQEGLTPILVAAGYQVVAAANSWTSGASALKQHQPHLCLIEIELPDKSGAANISILTAQSPHTLFVVLTLNESARELNAALSEGAAGYVHKTRGSHVLLDALSRVCDGEIVIEGSFARDKNVSKTPTPDLAHLARYLTHRESECLSLMAAGQGTEAMAKKLGVTPTTVRTHVQAVLVKLGVHSRLEAAALATRYGLVDRDFKAEDNQPNDPHPFNFGPITG